MVNDCKGLMDMTNKSVYYTNSEKVAFASMLSRGVRQKIFSEFMEFANPTKEMKILDVGVTCDESQRESNFF